MSILDHTSQNFSLSLRNIIHDVASNIRDVRTSERGYNARLIEGIKDLTLENFSSEAIYELLCAEIKQLRKDRFIGICVEAPVKMNTDNSKYMPRFTFKVYAFKPSRISTVWMFTIYVKSEHLDIFNQLAMRIIQENACQHGYKATISQKNRSIKVSSK